MEALEDHTSWRVKVAIYLDRLQNVVDDLNGLLAAFKPSDSVVDSARIQQATERLRETTAQMETLVAARESLLSENDAPRMGTTLTAKLRRSLDFESHELASRCDSIRQALADAHHRAVATFVCQFHLAELSNELVGILSGASVSSTYGPPGAMAQEQGMRTRPHGGGLFNEAG